MIDLEQRRARAERELSAVVDQEQRRAWAARACEIYSPTERRRLLDYLTAWVKAQPGHGVECDCGECD